MNIYSTVRNTSFATVIVAALAGIVSNSVALNQQVAYERDVSRGTTVAVLPEVVVSATRLDR